ncbi:MAG: 7-carboxy-7-deazaguanine synthase [Candidatus Azotimanducaceae bacterium]|jgi:7-carboxy-7-deazaguanine synthase
MLRITEIFYSLQGESKTTGLATVFVRLTGCPLRCEYCDTSYAFSGGEQRSFENILSNVAAFKPRYVTVTGGEPLAQPNCIELLNKLCDAGYRVSLETSGALDVSKVDDRVSIVMDLKTPGSKEVSRNLYTNIRLLRRKDQIKFVICDREDYNWSVFKLREYQLDEQVDEVLFSPSADQLKPTDLADWIVQDNLPVRFQYQLHKMLWGDKPGV